MTHFLFETETYLLFLSRNLWNEIPSHRARLLLTAERQKALTVTRSTSS